MTTEKALLTKHEAARALRLSVRTLENIIKSRQMAVMKFGRSVRLEPAELARFKAARTLVAIK